MDVLMFSVLEVYHVFRGLLVIRNVCLNYFKVLHNKNLRKWFKITEDWRRIEILKSREWFSTMNEDTELCFIHELVKT